MLTSSEIWSPTQGFRSVTHQPRRDDFWMIKVHPADAPRSRVGEGEHAERIDEPERTMLGIVAQLTVLILFAP